MQTFLSTTYMTAFAATGLAAVLLGAGTVTGTVVAAGDGTHEAPSGQGATAVAGGSHGKPGDAAKDGNTW
ncbi:hypothetical protein QMZ92_17575 [Streptomyces sp. HNM0645]|uniref:hypothetical protein n=1 Tax=Streptomyces sp. HNM0645 TaxID=2782343 RepID=UPI0024B71B44|nr:hypothetical protein [Streptomyces sp. HNM0645]MDI9886142.1 hypothetical protein [Streptomyces sp. HNM0645]